MLIENISFSKDFEEVKITVLVLRAFNDDGFKVRVVCHDLLFLEYPNIGIFQWFVVVNRSVQLDIYSNDAADFV